MHTLMGLFVLCMIYKDVTGAPFPNVMRGVAQISCLAAGLAWLVYNPASVRFSQYWPLWSYIAILLLAAPLADHALFVVLEVLSLASAILFFVAYFEARRLAGHQGTEELVRYVIWAYALVAICSLFIATIEPDMGYETLYAGDAIGDEIRFRGVMSKAGQLGAAGGLLLGLTAITQKPSLLKWLVCLVALTVVLFTQSRTFWIGGAIAALATMWAYYPRLLRRVSTLVLVAIAVLGVLAALINAEATGTRLQKFARIYNLDTLNGRVGIWDDVIVSLQKRPLFGFGFTLGSSGLSAQLHEGPRELSIDELRLISRQTTHNGYLQSVMDSGILGTVFYLAAIITAFWRVLSRDTTRQYPEAFYVLLFLAVSNGAESVIHSGAVFHSLLFWVFAVFAMSLRKADTASPNKLMMNPSKVSTNPLTPRFSNLLH
jgi:hypothetical protein